MSFGYSGFTASVPVVPFVMAVLAGIAVSLLRAWPLERIASLPTYE